MRSRTFPVLIVLLPSAGGFSMGCTGGNPPLERFASVEVAVSLNGRPQADQEITLWKDEPGARLDSRARAVETAGDGRAVIDSLVPGTYTVAVDPSPGAIQVGCTTAAAPFPAKETPSYLVGSNSAHSEPLPLERGDQVRWSVSFSCPFEEVLARLPRYRDIAKQVPTEAEPRVSGKLLVVNDRDVDELTFRLPEDLRPRAPAEVGTVAVIGCESIRVGHYAGGPGGPAYAGPAYRVDCAVTLIDPTREVALSRQAFSSHPAGTVTVQPGGAAFDGSTVPYREIRAYLLAMPRTAIAR